MPRFFKDRKKKHGQAPGSLVFIGNKKMDEPHISVLSWDSKNLTEQLIHDPNKIKSFLKANTLTWINLYGIHDPALISEFGSVLDIPNLILEDIMNTDQRPKYTSYNDVDAFILKTIILDKDSDEIQVDQVSLVMGKNFVISFQEKKAMLFDSVRERIRKSIGRIRESGTDYLVYVLLDMLIDNYLDVIGRLGENIEELGREIISNPSKELANRIYTYKIEINLLRKFVRPAKELIFQWSISESEFKQDKNEAFIQDLGDLTTQATENIEIYGNLLTDGLNIYNTNLNNKANEIMKVLTIFASIFIPLTFFAGIYGMNFEFIPELKFKYAYPFFWLIAIFIGTGLLFYFKRRKWL